jgi:hypothetical protein
MQVFDGLDEVRLTDDDVHVGRLVYGNHFEGHRTRFHELVIPGGKAAAPGRAAMCLSVASGPGQRQQVPQGGTLATTALGRALPTVGYAERAVVGVLSSAAAPVLLVGGWTIAAALQPSSFDPVTDTVSTLAAVGAVSRWLMTLTFLVVGTCDVITGLALRPAGVPASGSTGYLPSSKYRAT